MNYKHLTREERYAISRLKSQGHSASFIAAQIGRHKSTINRELKRNASLTGSYRFTKADALAVKRSKAASCRSQRADPLAWDFAVEQLTTEQWSPEQIADNLKK